VQPADREGDRTVNKVVLTGRLTRDPEMRSLASGKNVTTFSDAVCSNVPSGRERWLFATDYDSNSASVTMLVARSWPTMG
jgi:single-stranded DNA-binding protein